VSRIMIIDDDFDILRYADSILAAKGHEVVVSSDPRKALDTLASHNVDLLVVDIVMPECTGFDVLRAVKKFKHLQCPILMLTGKSAREDVRTALSLGATDYMVKPFDRDVFLSKVESILGMQASSPEVKFAAGSPNANAEVTFPALITGITEMGCTMRTLSYVDRNVRIKIATTLFKEIGIDCPALRAVSCRPLDDDADYHYEVFVSFIGLDELSMKKIRRWIAGSAILKRKAS
jgi:DNA-binding response OmpR family regulator